MTRQNLRNKNPITSFLFAKSIFDFPVNSTCDGETERKCVCIHIAKLRLVVQYIREHLDTNTFFWQWIYSRTDYHSGDRYIQHLNFLPKFSAIFAAVKMPAMDANICKLSLKSSMTLDVLISLYDLLLYCYLQVSLILLFDLHIVLVCHLTLIF